MKKLFVTLGATWFASGLSPKAPGTMGTVAALPFAWAIALYAGQTGLLIASLICFMVGIWFAGAYAQMTGIKDPGAVVIDEVAGQWLALAFIPFSWAGLAAGFVLFRLFDILKPWPISWLDKNTRGGFGIMIDDMAAGLAAGLILYGLHYGGIL